MDEGKVGFILRGNWMVPSTDPRWLQTAFNTLTRLFNRVGLQTNILKNVGMVCQPCRAAGVRADKAYTRQMMAEGRSYKRKQREMVLCPECRKDLEKGSLVAHLHTRSL